MASLLAAPRSEHQLVYIARRVDVTRSAVEQIVGCSAAACRNGRPPPATRERPHEVARLEARLAVEVSDAELFLGGVRDPAAREHEPADRAHDIGFPMASL